MEQLFGSVPALGWIALKALLLYLTAIFGFRLGKRRTLAEMSAFDFVAAVAVGAIVGRVPNSSTTSYLAGAVTLVTILVCHRIVTGMRHSRAVSLLFDHPPKVLIKDGQIVRSELHRTGLTEEDLHGILRQHSIVQLNEVRYAIFEQRGKVSVIRQEECAKAGQEPELLRGVLQQT